MSVYDKLLMGRAKTYDDSEEQHPHRPVEMGSPAVEGDGEGQQECARDDERESAFWIRCFLMFGLEFIVDSVDGAVASKDA